MESLSPQLSDALLEFSARPKVLVALDFDGTLSPLVDDPQAARPIPEAAALVEQLGALDGVFTAVVSGRNLESLAQVYPAPRPSIQIGSHGAERVLPEIGTAGWQNTQLTIQQEALLGVLTARLQEVADRYPKVSLEFKPTATVIHVRRASQEDADRALHDAQQALQDLVGVKVMLGKAVLEASVLHTDKGKALSWLRDSLGVEAVLFAGDDVTDENAFKVLQSHDLGVKVGDGSTAAAYRISSPFDLIELLKNLISMRN